jgi:hypothetical protein
VQFVRNFHRKNRPATFADRSFFTGSFRKPERQNGDVPDGVDFYLKLLSNAEDNSVEILSIGFTQVLAGLLKHPIGGGLVASMVKHLWIMAGKDRGFFMTTDEEHVWLNK